MVGWMKVIEQIGGWVGGWVGGWYYYLGIDVGWPDQVRIAAVLGGEELGDHHTYDPLSSSSSSSISSSSSSSSSCLHARAFEDEFLRRPAVQDEAWGVGGWVGGRKGGSNELLFSMGVWVGGWWRGRRREGG